MNRVYDVAVVGAGPGGSAAAHYLARAGLDVLLVDKFEFPRDKTCGDAMTPRALTVLEDMGLLAELRRTGYHIRELELFAPRGHSTVAAIPEHPSRPDYALIVPRLILDNAIRERALASGATFAGGVHVAALEPNGGDVVIRQRGERGAAPIRARLAVVATGANVNLLLQSGLLPQAPPLMLAARTYYEELSGLEHRIQFRFDGVPLPGYGWVFPVSDSAANVGAGFFTTGWPARPRRMPATPGIALENFLRIPPLRALLAGGRQAGPVKGFPLRVDFATAPTFGERVLLVGEAAGLVNPLTGEGIDYALESGKIAAEHVIGLFAAGDLARPDLAAYDELLRRRFQRLFVFCTRLRNLFMRPLFLNRLIRVSARRADVTGLLIGLVLGDEAITGRVSRQTFLKTILALLAAEVTSN